MKVLITGVSGSLGRLVTHALLEAGHNVCGIDRRAWDDCPEGVRVYNTDLRGVGIHDRFRSERPDVVVHLAASSPFAPGSGARHRGNLILTRALLDAVAQHGVSQLVFASRHLYYGAAADLPLVRREDDPPYGVQTFPEAADLIASDLMVSTALWRIPRMRTLVLRFCHPLGAARRGILAQLLQGTRVPTVLGFDPLVQFLHSEDVAAAICTGIELGLFGVYNVGGNRPLALSRVAALLGRSTVSIPESLYRISVGRFGFPEIPAGSLSLLKYPIVVDDSAFRSRAGFVPRYDELQTLEHFRAATAPNVG